MPAENHPEKPESSSDGSATPGASEPAGEGADSAEIEAPATEATAPAAQSEVAPAEAIVSEVAPAEAIVPEVAPAEAIVPEVAPAEATVPVAEPTPQPPAPAARDLDADLASLASPWGIITRTLTLYGLMGASLVLWAQFTFRARWVTKFLTHNELELFKRMTLIKSAIVGGIVFALVVGVVMFLWRRRGRDIKDVERGAWFASPFILFPTFPLLFRYKPWMDRAEDLLPLLVVVMLAWEAVSYRSLSSVPALVSKYWRKLVEKVPGFLRRHGPLIVVVLGAVGYAVFMSFYTVRWHHKIQTHNFDLAINNNLFFGTLHGKFHESPVVFPDDPGKYLATHAKLGVYPLLPFYAIYPRPETLMVIQSTLLGLAALPLFGFARKRLSDWTAAALALCYLAYHPMHSASFSEMQFVPVATFFVFATIWALDARRWVWFGLAFFCACLMREDIGIGLAIAGTFCLLAGHRPIAGLVMAVLATGWFVYLRFHVMDQAGEWWFPTMYKQLWSPGETGFKSVIKTLLSNPLFVLQKITIKEKLFYLLQVLLPLAFLPARRWYLWAAFIPGTILTLLSTDYKPIYMHTFHYVMHWTPYVFLGAALALAAIRRDNGEHGKQRMGAALIAMILATSVLSYNYGAFPRRKDTIRGGYFKVDFGYTPAERERYQALTEIIKLIPPDASVSATELVGPHVSSRITLHTLRQGPKGAEYLLASSKELNLDRTKDRLKAALVKGEYGVIGRQADFAVFKKGADTSKNAQLMRDWRM